MPPKKFTVPDRSLPTQEEIEEKINEKREYLTNTLDKFLLAIQHLTNLETWATQLLGGLFIELQMTDTRSTAFRAKNESIEDIVKDMGPGADFDCLQYRLIKHSFLELAAYLESILKILTPLLKDTLPGLDVDHGDEDEDMNQDAEDLKAYVLSFNGKRVRRDMESRVAKLDQISEAIQQLTDAREILHGRVKTVQSSINNRTRAEFEKANEIKKKKMADDALLPITSNNRETYDKKWAENQMQAFMAMVMWELHHEAVFEVTDKHLVPASMCVEKIKGHYEQDEESGAG